MTAKTAKAKAKETLLIRGMEVPVQSTTLPQIELRFFVDNPRVYSILRADGEEPSQATIERKLLEMDHVKALIQDIKRNGGLTDPVIVRAGKLEVLEGNSRLAAYRALAKLDPIKWGQMKCRLLPADIDEGLVFALLGQYHIKGKKDWAPFEQAGFLYRRFKVHDVDVAQLAQEIGLSKRKVEHLIDTYQFMYDHGEADTARWSYYDEYLKSSQIRKARLSQPGFDDLVVNKIKSGEIPRAVDVRDRLPVICSAPKALQKFATKIYDFEESHEQAVEAGADSAPYKRLAKFRLWLVKPDVEAALGKAQGETRKKIQFELDKLAGRIDVVRGKLKSKG
ncbi:ParB N-terminal domain-containing protein [Mesorhizobium sp. M7A.F.Ca.US.010.02.1.1]|uniref:ParB N-terminal domain-containing protein n=1 Tax=Mesorhizobium sp. M7A.F.Ca.US.010.02.1.1 TaxID=2496743 RepID=UPI000FD40B18|nr:ParB N-terminal domain-containing protein [Mesorhizobium sp. M7A.F.Ca.US.010.02.1.1]RUW94397.1 hypothetical protein EOA19_03385 [Mesorhizobium sp. M7A.F.Ca.US.010.02.1.1]